MVRISSLSCIPLFLSLAASLWRIAFVCTGIMHPRCGSALAFRALQLSPERLQCQSQPRSHYQASFAAPANRRRRSTLPLALSSSLSSSMSSSATHIPTIPRAAVSVVVRCNLVGRSSSSELRGPPETYYLLVQRGQAPNKGIWSFPGGKIEYGESTLDGGQRELREETDWHESPDDWDALRWHNSTIGTSDSIGEGYHYVIAQCFAELTKADSVLPILRPADDADATMWSTLPEIQRMCAQNLVTPGVLDVLYRVEALERTGLLEK